MGALQSSTLTEQPRQLLAIGGHLGVPEQPGDLLVAVGALLELRHEGGVELQGDPGGPR